MESQLAYLRKQKIKINLSILFSCFFLLLLGSTSTLLALDNFFLFSIDSLPFEKLVLITISSFVGLILSLLYRLQKKLQQGTEYLDPISLYDFKTEVDLVKSESERFRTDLKLVLKSQLRVSILFWTHYYKREKMMSYHDAKREIFKNMKKEFSQVYWMTDVVAEIKREIDEFDRSKTRIEN